MIHVYRERSSSLFTTCTLSVFTVNWPSLNRLPHRLLSLSGGYKEVCVLSVSLLLEISLHKPWIAPQTIPRIQRRVYVETYACRIFSETAAFGSYAVKHERKSQLELLALCSVKAQEVTTKGLPHVINPRRACAARVIVLGLSRLLPRFLPPRATNR